MKNTISQSFFVLFLSLFVLNAYSQNIKQISNPETPKYRVFYAHEHIRDLEKPDVIHEEEMMLLVGEKSSLFTSYSKLKIKNQRDLEFQAQLREGNTRINMPSPPVLISEEYLIRYGGSEMHTVNYLASSVVYKESVEPVSWDISAEEKEIEGMKVYKATTHYKGRDWEVWFTPEIPIPAGPWLLNGLPGLILEAQDKEKQVSYLFTYLESESVENEVIKRLKDYNRIQIPFFNQTVKITHAEYLKLYDEALKNYSQFRNAQITKYMNQIPDPFNVVLIRKDSWATSFPNPIAK